MSSAMRPRSIQRSTIAAISRLLIKILYGHADIAISVVISTRNQATYLDFTLAALERQLLPKDVWEVVVLDNASQDNTPAILEEHERRQKLPLIWQQCPRRCGRVAMLNKAIAISHGCLLVLINDDRLVQPGFLFEHLLMHIRRECVVIGDDHYCIHTHLFAPDEYAQEGIPASPFMRPQDLDDPQQMASLVFSGPHDYRALFAHFNHQRQRIPYPWACFSSANTSLPREAIERVGGFDERFLGCGLEDIDLAYRLHQAGLDFQFASKALTLRQQHPQKVGQQRDLDRNFSYFLAKHPNLNTIERELILRGNYFLME